MSLSATLIIAYFAIFWLVLPVVVMLFDQSVIKRLARLRARAVTGVVIVAVHVVLILLGVFTIPSQIAWMLCDD